MDRHGKQLRIISHENRSQRVRQPPGEKHHHDSRRSHQQITLFQQALQLPMVSRAVMIPHHRPGSNGIANKHRHKNKLDIHQYAIGSNTVFTRKFQ